MQVGSQRKTKVCWPDSESAADDRRALKLVGLALPGLILQSVVHEINNPLSAVGANIGVLEAMLEEIKEFLTAESRAGADLVKNDSDRHELDRILIVLQQAQECLNDATEGAAKAGCLLGHLRDLAPFAQEEERLWKLGDLVENALELLAGRLKYKVEIFKELNPVPLVRGRYSDLLRLLVCLIGRAGQVSGESGRVGIRTWTDGQTVVITIEDRGLAHDHGASVSDGHGRSPKPAELFLVKSLDFAAMVTRDLGGWFMVEKNTTAGTKVHVRLPAAPAMKMPDSIKVQ